MLSAVPESIAIRARNSQGETTKEIHESMHLIVPHGRALLNLFVGLERARELKEASEKWVSWDLTPHQL